MFPDSLDTSMAGVATIEPRSAPALADEITAPAPAHGWAEVGSPDNDA